jgi:hypothetical protein
MSILEYDDTVRAKGITLAILAHLFDYSTGLGNISPDPYSHIYLFDRSGTPLVGLWSTDHTNKSIALSLLESQLKAYDMMGNPISVAGSIIQYNRTPIYVEGQGVSVDTFRTAIENGIVSAANDSLPPNLSMVDVPRGPANLNPLRLRWIAIDETSIPSDLSPEAILYSYQLQGIDTNWSEWSAKTVVEYHDLPDGVYTFSVKAKDEAGNISPTVSKEIVIESIVQEECECDLNGDGSCNGVDWLLFYPDWGRTDCNAPNTELCECDLNGDGSCNGVDWLLFYPDWGRTDCP